MSILIKRMEMPDNCRECPFEMYYMNCGQTRCRATGKILADFYKPIPFEGRAEECPIAEIPTPHGDLIDRDTLLASENQHYEYRSDSFYVETRTIELAPTIIGAEEGE